CVRVGCSGIYCDAVSYALESW
nr:immunoglobulin heavy chain junction region [Macaca mulatta]